MVVDEGHEITTDFPPVEGSVALRFEAVEEGLGTGEPLDDAGEGLVVRIAEHTLRQSEIEKRVQAEKHGSVAVQPRCVLADVAVVDLVVGRGDLAEQEEAPFAEGVGIFPDVRAKPRTGELAHVLDGVHPEYCYTKNIQEIDTRQAGESHIIYFAAISQCGISTICKTNC